MALSLFLLLDVHPRFFYWMCIHILARQSIERCYGFNAASIKAPSRI